VFLIQERLYNRSVQLTIKIPIVFQLLTRLLGILLSSFPHVFRVLGRRHLDSLKLMAYLRSRARIGTVYVYAQYIVRFLLTVQQQRGSTCLKKSDKTGYSSDTHLQPTHDKYVAHVPISVSKIPLDDDLATVLILLSLPTTTPQSYNFHSICAHLSNSKVCER